MPARVGDARRRRASAWVLATLSALGVLAVIALVAALMLNQRQTSRDVAVPSVLGYAEEAAKDTLTRAGLNPVRGDPVRRDDCTKGQVAAQDPRPDSTVARDTDVHYQICEGPATVTIPANLEGGTFESVEGQLKSLGLRVDREDEDSDQPKGIVLRLDPPSGSKVAPDSRITVYVSKGNVGSVPDVINFTEDQARARLKEAGYDVRVREGEEVDPAEAGKVTAQNPRPGTKLAAGKTVTITVTVPREDEEPTPDPSGPASPPPGTGGGGNGGGGLLPPLVPSPTRR